MAVTLQPRDRLQPALLDRLIDEQPQQRTEPEARVAMTRTQLRQAVLRDLSWLLNAVQSIGLEESRVHPQVAQSVLNFGLPPMAGQQASRIDVPALERRLKQAIIRFEPRLLESTLSVRAQDVESVLVTHNVIEFEIRGDLWAQPVPLALLLRTRLDLEAGQVQVLDSAAPGGGRG
jgi:type VI secretion system protein ImpF